MSCETQRQNQFKALVAMGSVGAIAFVVCLTGTMLVVFLRLHRRLTYRLSLYMVVSGMFSGAICSLEALVVNYHRNERAYVRLCITLGFLLQYSMWVKLLFTAWITFHLFCLAVWFRNFRKCELCYVASAVLFPLVTSGIPLVHGSYGLAGPWCWIQTRDANCSLIRTGVIEEFALWFVPSTVILAVESVAVVIIVIVYLCRIRSSSPVMNEPCRRALKQMLPLLVYPVMWCVLSVPTLVDRAYDWGHARPVVGLLMTNAILTPGWNVVAGSVLIIHIGVVLLHSKRSRHRPSALGSCCCCFNRFQFVSLQDAHIQIN